MRRITRVTRHKIREGLESRGFVWYGRSSDRSFLGPLYDLNAIPSNEPRFKNVEEEIWQHCVNNPDDWPEDWVYDDPRFGLMKGEDEVFLRFLCRTLHPEVRVEKEEALSTAEFLNSLLRVDGWELHSDSTMSGHPVIAFRELKGPFTMKRFAVALSFPGEKRPFVQKVAESLCKEFGKDRVFYDKNFEAELARPDLDTYLQRIYHDESELIAIFLCAEYEKKEWCGLEWRAVRDLIKKRQSRDIMPFRFDDTEIPGLFSIDGYISLDDRSPEEASGLILQRHRLNSINPQ